MSKKSDKAFIKKISSITIGTGAKPSAPKCPGCGGQLKVLAAIGWSVRRVKEKKMEERSFAA